MCTSRARATTSSGWAYSRSIRSRTRRRTARSRRRCWKAGVASTRRSWHIGRNDRAHSRVGPGMGTYVVAEHPSGPEVLEFREEPDRAPGVGEVAIDVKAIGVNPVDIKQRKADGPAEFPLRPGHEIAGVVAAVGEGSSFRAGDEVLAFRVFGGYATRLVVPADDVFLKPANLSFEEASGLLLVGVTAAHALTRV